MIPMTPDKNIGTIIGELGPMFAGKTTKLLKAYSMVDDDKRILFKPSMDNRYSEGEVVSHDGYRAKSYNLAESIELLDFMYNKKDNYNIFIDEVQFFDDNIIEIFELLSNHGDNIMYSGLDTDYRGEKFKLRGSGLLTIDDIVHISDKVTYNKAKCGVCNGPAEYTFRKSNDSKIFLLGGADVYEPRCEEHFYKK